MIVRSPSAIEHYRRLSSGEMGLGSTQSPSDSTLDLSAYFSSFMGNGGEAAAAGAPRGDGWDGATPAAGSALCVQPLFPWVGRTAPESKTCVPVLNIPSPWGMVLTGVVAFLVVKKVTE